MKYFWYLVPEKSLWYFCYLFQGSSFVFTFRLLQMEMTPIFFKYAKISKKAYGLERS
jgi:hypothetical protein